MGALDEWQLIVLARLGLIVPTGALIAAACCVLPMTFMLVGLGGAWLTVFGTLAAFAPYVIAVSALFIAAAWFVALRRPTPSRTRAALALGTLLTGVAWLVVRYEAALNDRLTTLM